MTAVSTATSKVIRKFNFLHPNHIFSRNFSLNQSKNMKFIQFSHKNEPHKIRVGYMDPLRDCCFVDINKASCSLPSTMLGILQQGDALEEIKVIEKQNPDVLCMSDVIVRAPITGVDKVLCVGLNYKDHCEEQNLTPPAVPMIFSKFPSCLIGQSEPLRIRKNVTEKVDWEVELALIIGKKASFVKAVDAHKYIFGYTVAQDISARDWQKEKNGGQFTLGKSMDGFCPIGPWIVTADEVDPETLGIVCSVNGANKQCSNTRNLIHKIPYLIERITSVLTLQPGDVILTGTPGGVGMHRNPPEYLIPGDLVVSEIEKIGKLTTKVVDYEDEVCFC